MTKVTWQWLTSSDQTLGEVLFPGETCQVLCPLDMGSEVETPQPPFPWKWRKPAHGTIAVLNTFSLDSIFLLSVHKLLPHTNTLPTIGLAWKWQRLQCFVCCWGTRSEPTTFLQWSNCANRNTYDWQQQPHLTFAAACFSFQPWQTYPEKMTLFTPNHALFSSGCTFRPLGVFPFTVLLMEGKWSRSAGILTTELSGWFGLVSIWTSQKQFNSCISSPFWGWRKPPVAQQRGDTMFDGFKRWAQRKNHQKGERVSPEVFFILLLNSVCSLLAFWKRSN